MDGLFNLKGPFSGKEKLNVKPVSYSMKTSYVCVASLHEIGILTVTLIEQSAKKQITVKVGICMLPLFKDSW